MIDVLVIGGGPAGIMAAYAAAKRGLNVQILEQNEKLGKKLFITGKGRCNITNACDLNMFFQNIVRNPKFLMSALNKFSNDDLLALLKSYGLQTKVERGNRVFPTSDKSNDVIRTLEKMLDEQNVRVNCNTKVEKIEKNSEFFTVITNTQEFSAKAIIVATGGLSYPKTGSKGDGYKFAEKFEHSIVKPTPALSALEDARHLCEKMQGLTLKNIGFTLLQNNKKVYYEQGELLFTHFGISGPVVLTGSSYINSTKEPLELHAVIDLKPALSVEMLEARLIRDFKDNVNKELKTYMSELLPSKMIHPFLTEGGFKANGKINSITKEERSRLVNSLKSFKIKILGMRPIEEAIVTAGGIKTGEINPSTMESKKVRNLYFAGEVVDVSAKTGGFNLQIAFSTGYLCGINVLN